MDTKSHTRKAGTKSKRGSLSDDDMELLGRSLSLQTKVIAQILEERLPKGYLWKETPDPIYIGCIVEIIEHYSENVRKERSAATAARMVIEESFFDTKCECKDIRKPITTDQRTLAKRHATTLHKAAAVPLINRFTRVRDFLLGAASEYERLSKGKNPFKKKRSASSSLMRPETVRRRRILIIHKYLRDLLQIDRTHAATKDAATFPFLNEIVAEICPPATPQQVQKIILSE